ncbi:tetratricopeptide repeat protein [Megasphaera sp.]|uniref:tetratricopeptide repeat protein n=1 Tax=Megasphaera sp. TaxID=2023260 RepID=UPI0025794C55|nr:tetratricopeptide repeat protein [Megasphaera sp.]
MKDSHPYELKNALHDEFSTVRNLIQEGYDSFLGLGCAPDLNKAYQCFSKAGREGDLHSRQLAEQIKQYRFYWRLASPDCGDNEAGAQLVLGLYLAQAGWIEKGIRNCPGSIYWFKQAFKRLKYDSDVQPFARDFLKRYAAGMDVSVPVIQFIKQQVFNNWSYYTFIWGVCLEHGLSVPQDEKAAFRWYMKAADDGQYRAFAALSRCYAQGIAVPVNSRLAAVYEEKYNDSYYDARYSLPGAIGMSSYETSGCTKKSIQEQPIRSDGKEICRTLRTLRAQFASANHIPWNEPECPQKAPCSGTCPACEKALRDLIELARKQPDCIYPPFELVSHEPDITVRRVKRNLRLRGHISMPKK